MTNSFITHAINNLEYLCKFLEILFSHPAFLFTVTFISLALKTVIIYYLSKQKITSPSYKRLLFLLIFVIVGALIEDISWIVKLFELNIVPSIEYSIVRFVIRLAWIFYGARYFAFSLFIEGLAAPDARLSLRQKTFFCCTGIYIVFLTGCMIINANCSTPAECHIGESIAIRALPLFMLLIMIPSIYYTRKKLQAANTPKILKKQLSIIIPSLVIPNIVIDLVQAIPLEIDTTSLSQFVINSFTFVGFSNILLTYMLFYCARKMVGLRFLNINKHVESPRGFSFIDNFKEILEQLSYATSMQELNHITQDLFRKAFNIPPNSVSLHINSYNTDTNLHYHTQQSLSIATTISSVLSTTNNELLHDIQKSKIFIYDELSFSNFYERHERRAQIIEFLEEIYADIIIPIYNQQKVIGCIVIERNARQHELYSNVERDEMIVFASYLGNIVNLLQNRNLEQLIEREKELREELYSKHQENNQYKESIRSFLKNNNHKKIGIIFYKNRQFVFGNREAKELIPINLNMHDGHPLTKICKNLVSEVQQYKSAQTCFTEDSTGEQLVIYGVPHLENNQVTILVYYPEASDLITRQIDRLKDPSLWDYMLYLETTESGKLINNLIPGTGEQLLSFKIELLKTSMSNKATLIAMPSEDIMPTVELLHHVSLRTTLHTIALSAPQITSDISIKLFGINSLFCKPGEDHEPILKKLDGNGTLFIQNIHFLNRETQDALAEFIRYGFFRLYKSDQKIFSNVRVICSSNQPLHILTQENKFSNDLLKELQKTTLTMPSLFSLPEQEIEELTDGYVIQALQNKTYEKILELNDRDRKKIVSSRPSSLQELKKRVQSLLAQKSRSNDLATETTLDPAYQITDPELADIARLGKHALKDERAMNILWHKFNNQNKIALFLGVNRSTVNRRCKQYNLL